jgi:FAD synthase
MIPADGVYAGRIAVSSRQLASSGHQPGGGATPPFPPVYGGERGGVAAAVNVGPNPTFAVQKRKVEAHLLGFSGDLYGQTLTLEFIRRLRDTRKFPSAEALQQQLRLDVDQVRKMVEELPVGS